MLKESSALTYLLLPYDIEARILLLSLFALSISNYYIFYSFLIAALCSFFYSFIISSMFPAMTGVSAGSSYV